MGQLKIYAAVASLAAFGILYFFYHSEVAKNKLLNQQIEAAYERHERDRVKIQEISQVSKDNQKLYEEAADDVKANIVLLSELESEIAEHKEKNNELVKLFSDHDFAKLFKAKPGLVIKRMRTGTDRVFQQLEDATTRAGDSIQNEEGGS